MMLDANIVAVKKGTGFEQPLAAHQHWHIDVVRPRFRLKGSRSILEELLLPAVEDRRLEAVLLTTGTEWVGRYPLSAPETGRSAKLPP
jgi:hypothetical protein